MGTRNLILTGFMATGKSTVGRLCASKLNYKFCDTDALIEERAGKTIQRIFQEDGEAAFRELERDVIAKVAALSGQVIATGGGAILSDENGRRLNVCGAIVLLNAEPQTTLERAGEVSSRPLLANSTDPIQRIETLRAEREAAYKRYAKHTWDTDNILPDALADQIIEWYQQYQRDAAAGEVLQVGLGERAYPIYIHKGSIASNYAAELINDVVPAKNYCLVTHPELDALYAQPIADALQTYGCGVHKTILPSGETSKNLETVSNLYTEFLAVPLDRRGVVIVVGGGVLGDSAGFAAATYLRGIRFVQVPTTLLAQVDASVGGKTGVDLPAGKNLVGAFHQPSLVLIDLATLATLPEAEFLAGLAEVVKYGIIYDTNLFIEIETNLHKVVARDSEFLAYLVRRSCEIKAEVVAQDETEQGLRAILNFGHTIGHALEQATQYQVYLHGEAVSIGMVSACLVGEAMHLTAPQITERLVTLLQKVGLPTCLPANVGDEAILKAAHKDKKAQDGSLRFVLAKAIGEVTLPIQVSNEVTLTALQRHRNLDFGGNTTV